MSLQEIENQIVEKYIDVKNYEGFYKISNFGNVKSIRTNKVLKPYKFGKGNTKYLCVILCVNNNKKHKQVHRLVASAFITNKKNKLFVNHKDGNGQNNHVTNLQWCTSSENNKHAYAYGLKKSLKGQLCGRSKLKLSDILKIKKISKKYTKAIIAKMFNVTPTHIGYIINNKTWRHLNG